MDKVCTMSSLTQLSTAYGIGGCLAAMHGSCSSHVPRLHRAAHLQVCFCRSETCVSHALSHVFSIRLSMPTLCIDVTVGPAAALLGGLWIKGYWLSEAEAGSLRMTLRTAVRSARLSQSCAQKSSFGRKSSRSHFFGRQSPLRAHVAGCCGEHGCVFWVRG